MLEQITEISTYQKKDGEGFKFKIEDYLLKSDVNLVLLLSFKSVTMIINIHEKCRWINKIY